MTRTAVADEEPERPVAQLPTFTVTGSPASRPLFEQGPLAGTSVTLGPLSFSASAPLTAWWCAERAAEALTAAGVAGDQDADRLIGVADGWGRLAAALATHPSMNRPRAIDERDQRR